jgi:ABC-type uncharacterized transport system involved in gliding motility auxiliary subunit
MAARRDEEEKQEARKGDLFYCLPFLLISPLSTRLVLTQHLDWILLKLISLSVFFQLILAFIYIYIYIYLFSFYNSTFFLLDSKKNVKYKRIKRSKERESEKIINKFKL